MLGDSSGREWGLPSRVPTLIGRGMREGPLIDLDGDRHVSRVHAKIWREAGKWWIQDLDSTNGTVVGFTNIAGRGPVPVKPGDSIRVGSSTLMLAPNDRERLRIGPVCLEFTFCRFTGPSLLLSGHNPLTKIASKNEGPDPTGELSLVVSGPLGLRSDITVPALKPWETAHLACPQWEWMLNDSLPPAGDTGAKVSVVLGQQVLMSLKINVVGWDVWLPGFPSSLVPFVPLADPRVRQLASRVERSRESGARFQELYEVSSAHLSDRPVPGFCPKPLGYRVENEAAAKAALFLCACMETLRLAPVLAFLRKGKVLRVLLGIRASNPGTVRKTAVFPLIDPGSLLAGDSFRQAKQSGVQLALRHGIAFTVDIVRSRSSGARPIPLRWS